ncbi:hypothetical protein TNCV_4672621 [Trichonephila clavipes]|nr:hypothetical protein TNCV_4672621 [Trichonephila clavipes]
MTKNREVHPRQPLRTAFQSLKIDNETAKLISLLLFTDYEERHVTRCLEGLPTTLHSELDTSAVAKPWKQKLQKSFYFLFYPRI